jgi:hypothetical protein
MQVTAAPSSSIFTLLTIIALIFLLVAVGFVAMKADARFGWMLPFGEQYDKTVAEHNRVMGDLDRGIREAETALDTVSLGTLPEASQVGGAATSPADL